MAVAGLQFVNLRADPGHTYFADGVIEDVITQLSKIRALHVIARASVMPFTQRDVGLREIGQRLGVAFVVERSVRNGGDRVRIVATLVPSDTGEQAWSETYDRQLIDIFAIQTDVALQLAAALRAELSRDEQAR